MIWNWNGNCRVVSLALHDDVASSLAHLDKSMANENDAHLLAREYAQFTQLRFPGA